MRTPKGVSAIFASLALISNVLASTSGQQCRVTTEVAVDWSHVAFGQEAEHVLDAVPGPNHGAGANDPPHAGDNTGAPHAAPTVTNYITLTTTWAEPCSTGYTTKTTTLITTHCGCTETPEPTITMTTVTMTPSRGWPFTTPVTYTCPVLPLPTGSWGTTHTGSSLASWSTGSPSHAPWSTGSSSHAPWSTGSSSAGPIGAGTSTSDRHHGSTWTSASSASTPAAISTGVVGTSTTSSSTSSSSTSTTSTSATSAPTTVAGIRNVGYFVNWAIYGRGFTVQDLQTQDLTHVLYAFANVNPTTGQIYLSDTWADTDKPWPGDDTSAQGVNLYGNLKQLYLRKKENRNLKTLLSVGGWTYSPNFAGPASTPEGRQAFAQSAVTLVQDLGFDGLDIDWEYPSNPTQAADFVLLLQATRAALEQSATQNQQSPFLLSVAVSAGPDNYNKLDMAGMDAHLDFWNLMAYDYVVSGATTSAHQANLYASNIIPNSTPFNTDTAVDAYLNHGIAPAKLVLGMPLYGRSFLGSTGPGTPCTADPAGSWEAGVWDYKALPKAGAAVLYDANVGAAYSLDNATGNFITYDSPASVQQKAQYVASKGLGGGMYWETSADKPRGQGSLIQAFANAVGALQVEQNELSYPASKYLNLRAGMP